MVMDWTDAGGGDDVAPVIAEVLALIDQEIRLHEVLPAEMNENYRAGVLAGMQKLREKVLALTPPDKRGRGGRIAPTLPRR